MNKYLFMVKDEVIVPIWLGEEGAEKVITSLVKEGFSLSETYMTALNSSSAYEAFNHYKDVKIS